MSHTTVRWRLASDPPFIPPGELVAVIVARRGVTGTWFVFGAVYLNRVELEMDNAESEHMTGFATDTKTPHYDDFYEPIDDVQFWAPMPAPPTPPADRRPVAPGDRVDNTASSSHQKG